MAYTEDLLRDSRLTVESIQQDMEQLKLYYNDLEMESRVVPALADAPLPTLVAALGEDEQQRMRIVTHSMLPLSAREASYTKFLQFYAELDTPAHTLALEQVKEAIGLLNGVLPLGTVAWVEGRQALDLPGKVCVRATQGYPIREMIDQGAFCETLFLFDLCCDLVSMVMDAMAQGKTPREAMDQLGT